MGEQRGVAQQVLHQDVQATSLQARGVVCPGLGFAVSLCCFVTHLFLELDYGLQVFLFGW
jgi:hypothetical protein